MSLAKRPAQQVIFISFGLYSFAIGTLFPRLGDLQLALGISPAVLGLCLAAIALGLQVSLLFSSLALARIGFKSLMPAAVSIIGLGFFLAALATHPLWFAAALFLAGLAIGLAEIVINLEADRVEQMLGRRIMNRGHAFWSLGFFVAGIVGAGLAQIQLAVWLHFLLVLLPASLGFFLLLAGYQPAPPRPQDSQPMQKLVRPTGPILLLVLVTLPAMLLEGAGIDWSVIFMRDMFATAPLVNGLALAVGALGQFLLRYFADPVVERHGPEKIARLSLIALFAGAVAVSTAWHPVMALAGFALMGMGNAVLFPLAVSAAARRTDRPAAVNVAALTQTAFLVFLLGPPLLGLIAEAVSLRLSFALALPLIGISLFLCQTLNSGRANP